MDLKIIFGLLIFGTAFAGPYTSYCAEQSNPCFQSNCYKLNGNWATNPATGNMDCMYDKNAYTDAQVTQAFVSCLQEVSTCESSMASSGSYTPTGTSTGSSSGGGCCASLVLIGLAGTAVFARQAR